MDQVADALYTWIYQGINDSRALASVAKRTSRLASRQTDHRCDKGTKAPVQAPAVFNSSHGSLAFPLQQGQRPMQIVAVEPVVVDGQRVLQVVHAVVPAAGHEDDLPRLLSKHWLGSAR